MRITQTAVMRAFLDDKPALSTDRRVHSTLGRLVAGGRVIAEHTKTGEIQVLESPHPWVARRVWSLRLLMTGDRKQGAL